MVIKTYLKVYIIYPCFITIMVKLTLQLLYILEIYLVIIRLINVNVYRFFEDRII